MAGNKTLSTAKNEENNEYYTRYDDIQTEINTYLEFNPDVFRNKVILLPCDDPEWSNFTKFFAQNFENFGEYGALLEPVASVTIAPLKSLRQSHKNRELLCQMRVSE